MTKLSWDQPGDRRFETGVDRGVLFIAEGAGRPWNGLRAVREAPTGGEATPYYIDGVKHLNHVTPDDFAGAIEAYTYPAEFEACEGTVSVNPGFYLGQQRRRPFNLSYRTFIGDDIAGQNRGYRLHLVYSATVSPAERSYSTIGEMPDPSSFAWQFTTKAIDAGPGYKATSHVHFDSTMIDSAIMSAIENVIYGTITTRSRLPTPAQLISLFKNGAPVARLRIDGVDGLKVVATPTQTKGNAKYTIHWGEGLALDQSVSPTSKSYVYADGGSKTITLVVEDERGFISVATDVVNVSLPPAPLPEELLITKLSDVEYSIEGSAVESISTHSYSIEHDNVIDNGDGSYTIITEGV